MGNQSLRMQLEINKHEQISKTAKNCSLCAYLFQIAWEKSFDYLLIIYKGQFLSRFSILRDKWRQPATSTLLDKYLTCELKRKNLFTLSNSCMKTEQFLLTVKSSLNPQLNVEELDHKAKENSLACGLDAAFLPNIFRVVRKLWAAFMPRRNH